MGKHWEYIAIPQMSQLLFLYKTIGVSNIIISNNRENKLFYKIKV